MFLAENKYLSLFFWQEFDLKTRLSNSSRSKDKISISFNENEYTNCIPSNNLSENDLTNVKEYKDNRILAKQYLKIFNEHINNEDHPVNIISKYFINVFTDFIEEKMILIEKNYNNPEFAQFAELKRDEITQSLQKFIIKLQNSLRLFYCKTDNYKFFIDEKDEFVKIVSDLLFSDSALYKYIFSFYEITILDKIEKLRIKMNELKYITPQELGIPDKFSLNESTLEFQKKLIIDHKKRE